jgi:hypothetical protein
MESWLELKSLTPELGTPRQNQIFPLRIASRIAFMRSKRFINQGLKPANVVIDRAHES